MLSISFEYISKFFLVLRDSLTVRLLQHWSNDNKDILWTLEHDEDDDYFWQFHHGESYGCWSDHLLGAKLMQLFIVAAGQNKYAKCLIQYILEIRNLPDEVQDLFERGLFNLKR